MWSWSAGCFLIWELLLFVQIVDATVEAIGADKVGLKLQQGVTFSGIIESEDDGKAQLAYLGPELEKRKLAYVCLSSLNYAPYFAWVLSWTLYTFELKAWVPCFAAFSKACNRSNPWLRQNQSHQI